MSAHTSHNVYEHRNNCKIINVMCTVEKYCFFLYFLVLALELQHTLALSVRKMVT